MEEEMMARIVEGGCPFAKKSGMRVREVAGVGRVTLVLEEKPTNLNAFGVVHAGAICGLAETAGGMALFAHLDPGEAMALNTVLNIRFRRMPRGELTCAAVVTGEEARILMEEFSSSRRADKAMDLKVRDSEGNVVAEAQATFRLIPTPEEFKKYFG